MPALALPLFNRSRARWLDHRRPTLLDRVHVMLPAAALALWWWLRRGRTVLDGSRLLFQTALAVLTLTPILAGRWRLDR